MEQGGADPVVGSQARNLGQLGRFPGQGQGPGDAAGAVDVASAETIGAGMGAIGGACKDCHTSYRIMK